MATVEERAQYREKLASIGFLSKGRAKSQTVVESVDEKGLKTKAVTDAAGNTVTEHADDRVDVMLKPSKVEVKTSYTT